MKLIQYGTTKDWSEHGYECPKYDRDILKQKTAAEPTWVHFGAGNIFRAFPAAVLERLLNEGSYDRGIVVCEGFDTEIIDKAYLPYDSLSLLVVLKADGSIEKRVIGSVTEAIKADYAAKADWERLSGIFRQSSLQMISFTITEKGYVVTDSEGNALPLVQKDIEENALRPVHIMGKLAALLYERFRGTGAPIAMVSMDNCSHNGDRLKAGVLYYAEKWLEKGLVPVDFIKYLRDTSRVSFPWSMIDKITPRPDETVRAMLQKDGFEDSDLIITSKNTYTAPFVNAEETEYLVIEDSFPNGRPPLELGGLYFTDRKTVDKVETMKVCTCLNPLHTSLAVFGCLLSYEKICDEMKDELLRTLVTRMAYEEAMPVVVDPGIISPEEFLEAVLKQRLPNPFMPDAPARIATDTSQKIPIRFGGTLKAYLAKNKPLEELTLIPLVLAGYGRYLLGINDGGEVFTPSPDPRLSELMSVMEGIKLGQTGIPEEALRTLYTDKDIFGIDLYEAGLKQKIEQMFMEMIKEPGAIRNTLKKYVVSQLA